jgi:LmbE family N-acetylglucosaminyl deacetylase
MNPDSFLQRLVSGNPFRATPRTLIVAAHPDDETIGMGSRLPLLPGVIIAHTTDGAPADGCDAITQGFNTVAEYAQRRRSELYSALALAGIAPQQTRELGCADQQAAKNMARLAGQIYDIVTDVRPDVIFTHPYEGGHPDHDATAFAVHAACARPGVAAPLIIEMTSYHNSGNGIEVNEFLFRSGHEPVTCVLDPPELSLKRKMFDCFPTQRQTLSLFPIRIERFRLAPSYDFTSPPHEGQLFYEMYPWGMTGSQFRKLAAEALKELELAASI